MSNFTKLITIHEEFEGDNVTVKASRLSNASFSKLGPVIEVAAHVKALKAGKEPPEINVKAGEAFQIIHEILSDHVNSISGLYDADGEPLSYEDIANEIYFKDLRAVIFSKILSASMVSDDSAKKSLEKPDDSLEG